MSNARVRNRLWKGVLFALATTAGISLPENPLEGMSPESIGEELGLAWPQFLSALARLRPTLVVIDDLHRGEPPLLDIGIEALLQDHPDLAGGGIGHRYVHPVLIAAPAPEPDFVGIG